MFQGLQAFIQFSVTFFSFDVNESDVKERSAPGEGLLDARPDQLPLHVVLLCDVPPLVPPLTFYHQTSAVLGEGLTLTEHFSLYMYTTVHHCTLVPNCTELNRTGQAGKSSPHEMILGWGCKCEPGHN